ncbi:glycosyltransferase [Neomicrococcus aestuarii]|uniref:glycosyltransferase n=1 Tax=Neomicrococcus aestuarii TaxID=556325 RepID=UPI0016190B61|nr:glycosyltransferase [Neomicrococcus aestuarii]
MSADNINISVVIPARHAAGTLGAQLRALPRQKVTVIWEVIVVSNNSTGRTQQLVSAWVRH